MTYMFWKCTALTNLDLSSWDTSKVTRMDGMFDGASSLESLDLSNWDTSSVTNMQSMFSYMSSLTTLNVSNWNTESVQNVSFMFQEVPLLRELDLSSWNLDNATSNYFMLGGLRNLEILKLGENTSLKPEFSLPAITADSELYTGNWQNVGSGTLITPKGDFIFSSADLLANYDGQTMADTYVWQKAVVPAENVIIRYLDEGGNVLHDEQIISGNVGDAYDATTAEYQLMFEGYTLDSTKLPNNRIGVLSDMLQEVIYVYQKDPITAAPIVIHYIDESGNILAADVIITGFVGEGYTSEPKAFEGYHLEKVYGNATGTFTDETQEITYLYAIDDDNEPSSSGNDSAVNDNAGTANNKTSDESERQVEDKNEVDLPKAGEQKNKALGFLGILFIMSSVIISRRNFSR